MMPRVVLLCVLTVLGSGAIAQSYPNRPVTLVVPYPPGGTTDAMGRITAQRLQVALGQQVVVDNRSGASGAIGSESVRRAQPDGYTLLFNASIFLLGRSVQKATPYDPVADFMPLARVGQVPLLMLAHPSVKATTIAQLVTEVEANPTAFNFANSAAGSAGHLASLEFKRLTGLQVPVVTYRGSAGALTDLVGGQVQLMFDPVGVAMAQVRAGKLRALLVTAAERTEAAPDVPTSAEAGLGELRLVSWYGVWGPRNMPDDVVARLDHALVTLSRDDEMAKRVKGIGVTPVFENGQAFAAFVAMEVKRNAALLSASGFQPE